MTHRGLGAEWKLDGDKKAQREKKTRSAWNRIGGPESDTWELLTLSNALASLRSAVSNLGEPAVKWGEQVAGGADTARLGSPAIESHISYN